MNLKKRHDQKTQVRQIPLVLAEEKSENRQAQKLGHVQDKSRRNKTRKGGAIFQAAVIWQAERLPYNWEISAAPHIRPATNEDRETIWEMFREIISAGDVFAFDAQMSREDALAFWCGPDKQTYVAEQNGRIMGSYYLARNHQGGGAHVANAGYMVSSPARGQHIGRAMCEHSLQEARRLGFRAMQFNFVVSTNESAVHLWKEFGFAIVGTLPGAFRHPKKGYVDVYVMFRSLLPASHAN
jgi:L-amino acid N-acyltransferase YncA